MRPSTESPTLDERATTSETTSLTPSFALVLLPLARTEAAVQQSAQSMSPVSKVLEMLADEFNEKALKGKDDVRKYPKAVGKLRKEAERVKDVLSANTAYQVHNERVMRG